MHSPMEIANNYVQIGINKVKLSVFHTILLGIFAGMFLAVTGMGATAASMAVHDPALSKLVSAMIFPAALVMVVIAGGELFTGNNLIIISALEKKVTVKEMLRNWGLVYLGNFLGAMIVSILIVYGHTPSLFNSELAKEMVSIAEAKVNLTFMDAFIRGILCNVLVCLAVWMSLAAKKVEGKFMMIYCPILIFVMCGYEHCAANMYYIGAGLMTAYEYGIVAEELTVTGFLFRNLLPVTLGNIVGGAGIVGIGCWATYLRESSSSKKVCQQ